MYYVQCTQLRTYGVLQRKIQCRSFGLGPCRLPARTDGFVFGQAGNALESLYSVAEGLYTESRHRGLFIFFK